MPRTHDWRTLDVSDFSSVVKQKKQTNEKRELCVAPALAGSNAQRLSACRVRAGRLHSVAPIPSLLLSLLSLLAFFFFSGFVFRGMLCFRRRSTLQPQFPPASTDCLSNTFPLDCCKRIYTIVTDSFSFCLFFFSLFAEKNRDDMINLQRSFVSNAHSLFAALSCCNKANAVPRCSTLRPDNASKTAFVLCYYYSAFSFDSLVSF